MKDRKKHARFIEQRAMDKSYTDISIELKVSKTPLVPWRKEHRFEIANLKIIEMGAFQRRLKINEAGRLEMFWNMLSRLQDEFVKRDLWTVSTEKFVDQIAKVSALIFEHHLEPNFVEVSPYCSIPEKWPA